MTHLLFVNDILLFYRASQNHIQVLRALLLCFEFVSDLKVSLSKSKLVPAGNVPSILSLANNMWCKVSTLPMTYLSPSLGVSFKSRSNMGRGIGKNGA